jgi:hypothetical protein
MVLLQWVLLLLSCFVLCCAYNKYKANYLCFVQPKNFVHPFTVISQKLGVV